MMSGCSRIMLVAMSGAIVGVLAACEPPPPQTVAALPPAVDTGDPRATLVVGARPLLGKVAVIDPRFRKVGRLTEVQVTVQNLTDSPYALEYKFDWKDVDGFVVESGHVWQPFALSPREIRNFKSVGKTPKAETITFTLRIP